MLNHPTLDQLRELKLDGMADAFVELQQQDRAGDLSHPEWLGLLLDRETANRSTKRFNTRLRAARLRHVGASVEDVDYSASRKLDKTALSGKMHAAMTTPSFTSVCRGSSPNSNWRMETAVSRACSGRSSRPICSSLMIGARIVSMPASDATSWRSSKTATARARQ